MCRWDRRARYLDDAAPVRLEKHILANAPLIPKRALREDRQLMRASESEHEEETMRTSKTGIALVALVALILLAALTRAAAQQGDLAAIEKRYRDLFNAGKYSEALTEAQQYEQAVKAQL